MTVHCYENEKYKCVRLTKRKKSTLPQMAPEGFDSVCGTEGDQQVVPVQTAATAGDNMAKVLLRKGDVYGKQYVVYLSNQAYPTYVVTYTVPNSFVVSSSPTQVTG